MKLKELSSGAEAIIFKQGNIVLKKRIKKEYRISEIDDSLRKFRTRREAKVMTKLKGIIPVPLIYKVDDKNMQIEMEFISGSKLRDLLTKQNFKKYSKLLGKQIAIMHSHDIIHGDLTTSNFIVSNKDNKLYFIDFGLSSFSIKVEDKAVDLHLLRQALESKHFQFWEEANKLILKEYESNFKDAKLVFSRLEKVEQRGRNKHK